jgi:hypothetical protein
LIALLLGRLKLSAQDAIDVYLELSESVFSVRQTLFYDSIFKSCRLLEAIQQQVKKVLGLDKADAQMIDEMNKNPSSKA